MHAGLSASNSIPHTHVVYQPTAQAFLLQGPSWQCEDKENTTTVWNRLASINQVSMSETCVFCNQILLQVFSPAHARFLIFSLAFLYTFLRLLHISLHISCVCPTFLLVLAPHFSTHSLRLLHISLHIPYVCPAFLLVLAPYFSTHSLRLPRLSPCACSIFLYTFLTFAPPFSLCLLHISLHIPCACSTFLYTFLTLAPPFSTHSLGLPRLSPCSLARQQSRIE